MKKIKWHAQQFKWSGWKQRWILKFRGPRQTLTKGPQIYTLKLLEASLAHLHIIFALMWKTYELFHSSYVALGWFIQFLTKRCKNKCETLQGGTASLYKGGGARRPPPSPPLMSTPGWKIQISKIEYRRTVEMKILFTVNAARLPLQMKTCPCYCNLKIPTYIKVH